MKKVIFTYVTQQSIDKYFKEIKSNPMCKPLSKEEEISLFIEYNKTKSEDIKNRIILSNLRWVISTAKPFISSKINFEDLINEGNIGLIEAFNKFDSNYGVRFITFAHDLIKHYIREYAISKGVDIKQPANRKKMYSVLNTVKKQFELEGLLNPNEFQIVDRFNTIKDPKIPTLDVNLLMEMKSNTNGFVEMETKIMQGDNNSHTLGDTFSADYKTNTDYNLNKKEIQNRIESLLKKKLNKNEYNFISSHFGLCGGDAKTLNQIADESGYTRERVGQIINVAIKTKLAKEKELLVKIFAY